MVDMVVDCILPQPFSSKDILGEPSSWFGDVFGPAPTFRGYPLDTSWQSDPDWIIPIHLSPTGRACTTSVEGTISSGDSDNDIGDTPMVILADLGVYCFGPLN
jgi:hypothetical protein